MRNEIDDTITANSNKIIYNDQSNKARYIYTLSERCRTNVDFCRLNNGLYFSKETKSDEKLCLTETNVFNLARTVFFMYAFDTRPKESMYDIIYSGTLQFPIDERTRIKESIQFEEILHVLDTVFGTDFCKIAHRPVLLLYYTYVIKWRFYNYGQRVSTPSANDIIDTYRFLKTPISQLSAVSTFILSRTNTDNRIPLQQKIKRLQ